MPLGVPMQQRPAGKPTPPRPMPGGTGGSQTVPPAKPQPQTVTVLPPNDPNQVPLSVNNPGPAQFYPPGTTASSRAATLPGQVVIGDIPKGVIPDGRGGVLPNYGLDKQTWDALQAAQLAKFTAADSLNTGLDFDQALAQVGNQYDRDSLGLNYMSDMARLNNSRYRDVDLARLGVRNAGDAAARMYRINSQQLADQLGFGERAFKLGMQSSDYGAGMQRRSLTDQSAAAGSASATGTAQGFTDIDRNLGFTQRGIRDTWDQVQANNVTGRQTLDSDWATTQADLSRQSKVIDSVAKDYGVTSSQMKQAFELGSKRLQLDWSTLVKKFTEAKLSNNAQAQAAADALLVQVLAAAQGG